MNLKHTIKYGDWFIYTDVAFKSVYAYHHDDYDGAPDSKDDRCGHAWTLEAAIEDINDYEAEHVPEMLREQAL